MGGNKFVLDEILRNIKAFEENGSLGVIKYVSTNGQ